MRHSQTPPRHEPKPAKSAQKLSNAAFWCPKERWTSTVQRCFPRGTVQHASETGKPQQDSSPTSQNHPSKKGLTLLSDALKKDEERPTQLPDITWQPASKLLKWHHLTGSGEIAKKTKENQAVDGHGLTASASLGLTLEAPSSTCIRNRETPAGFKPNQPKPSVEKVPDVAFWRPKERWRKANATAWQHLAGSVEIVKMTSPDRQRRNC